MLCILFAVFPALKTINALNDEWNLQQIKWRVTKLRFLSHRRDNNKPTMVAVQLAKYNNMTMAGTLFYSVGKVLYILLWTSRNKMKLFYSLALVLE